MIRCFIGLFILSLLFLFNSCSGGGGSDFVVGYLNPSSERERFVSEGNYMAERFDELGVEMIHLTAEDNDALQLEQGYELLEQGVDMIVIAAINGNTIAPLVREARRQGVKVMAYNRLINNAEYDLFFTGDNADIARMLCETALENSPRGNYVVFGGDRFDRNGIEVKQHIDSLLKPHIESGAINLLYDTYVEGWSGHVVDYEFRQIINSYGTDIDAVISCNDPMGLAVANVLNEYDMVGEVVITGQDAVLDAVRSVYNGEMTMTVYHPHRALGHRVAEVAYEILTGENIDNMVSAFTFNGAVEVPTFQMKSVRITKDNIQEELVDIGQFTWDEIRY